jgi:hypothetical protein
MHPHQFEVLAQFAQQVGSADRSRIDLGLYPAQRRGQQIEGTSQLGHRVLRQHVLLQ